MGVSFHVSECETSSSASALEFGFGMMDARTLTSPWKQRECVAGQKAIMHINLEFCSNPDNRGRFPRPFSTA
jgi:hypothetical protein